MKRKLLCLLITLTLIAGTLSAVIPSTVLGNTSNTPTPLAAPSEGATPNKYTPAVNNGDYGYTEQVEYYEGDEVTLTAVPFIGHNFDGWYASSAADAEKLSDSTLYTIATKKYSDVTDNFISDPGAENTAKGTVVYTAGGTSDEWTASSGASGSIEASHLRHNTGNQGLKTTITGAFIGRKLTGLKKNQAYKFSYWFYLPTSNSSQTAKIYKTLVTASSDAAAVNDSLALTDSKVLGYTSEAIGASKWQQVSVEFNTGDNSDVTVWFRIAISGFSDAMTFFDDFYLGEDISNASADLYNIEARFTPGADAVSGLGFETGYTVGGTPIVSFVSDKDPVTGEAPDGEYASTHSLWDITSQFRLTWQKLMVSGVKPHSGNNAIEFSGMYSEAGFKLPVKLKENTDYAVSFFYRSTGTDKYVDSVYIMTKDGVPTVPKAPAAQEYEARRDAKDASAEDVIALATDNVFAGEEWQEYIITFNSGSNTDVSIWIRYAGTNFGTMYFDSFNVYEYVEVSAAGEAGGYVSTSGLHNDKYAILGSTVCFSAVPEAGNTFAGWYANNELVSTEANYYMTATQNITLTAKFEGYNMPTREYFSVKGQDGSFENGTIAGWFGYHETDSSHWCSYSPYSGDSFEGKSSLRISARYRTSVLPLTGLNTNTNYVLSMYVKLNAFDKKTQIESIGIVGDGVYSLGKSGKILAKISNIAAGMEWQKVTLYFNTGDLTRADLLIYYASEDTANPYLYIDNMFLYEYVSLDQLTNGTFNENSNYWVNACDYDSAEQAGVISNTGKYTYQNINVEPSSNYTVKFRAKGELFAAATEIGAGFPNAINSISSTSNVTVNSSDWNEYSFEVYAGDRNAVTLAFGSLNGEAKFDNVTVTKNSDNSGAVLEVIDFETERFTPKFSDTSAWSIYEGGEGDANVHSGSKSLKFTFNNATVNNQYMFMEEFLGAQLSSGSAYRLTFWYKAPGGKSAGSIHLAPDLLNTYGVAKGFEYTPQNSDWNRVSFVFTASTQTSIQHVIKTIAGTTKGDFYFDDIALTVSEPALTQATTRYTYSEGIYNVVKNSNFEEPVSNDNWANLQPTMQIVRGDALKGSNYLSASAGTKYVLKVPVKAGTEYHFGASLRASSQATGYIGVTLSENVDSNGAWYCDEETAVPNSRFGVTKFDGEWHRQGFQFVSGATGYAYIAIVVTSGTIDFDSIQMFLPDYKYWYDPNDYTVYEDYDFEATTSPTCVINGGYGDQPYYKKAN